MKKIFPIALTACLSLAALLFSGCEKEDTDEISSDKVKKGVEKYTTADNKTIEYIDLGLPTNTLWATCNVGATSPEQDGLYFSWAETEPKQTYDLETYKWVKDGDQFCFTKYCIDDQRGYEGFIDNLRTLDKDDDPAIHYIDSIWHTPTSKNFDELNYWCTKKACKLNGTWGYLFTSTCEGFTDRSLFIPLAGFYDSLIGSSNSQKSKFGYYWANTLYGDQMIYGAAFVLQRKDGLENSSMKFSDRYRGLPVRAVAKGSLVKK